MSGHWRITVDSWITDDANWYARRIYDVPGDDAHSLVEALMHVVDLPVTELLDETKMMLRAGRKR